MPGSFHSAKIRLFPDPVLRRQSAAVKEVSPDILKIIRMLEAVMRAQRHGIGIAAPQIGISKRIAVVDVSSRISGAEKLVLINPRLLAKRKERPSREGCMSIPDYTADIKRWEEVHLEWTDEKGVRREKIANGIEAVCIQHEMDHLDGLLFIDRVLSLKRDMIPRNFPR